MQIGEYIAKLLAILSGRKIESAILFCNLNMIEVQIDQVTLLIKKIIIYCYNFS